MSRADRYFALSRRTVLTPLNFATSALYNACRSNGGHVASGDTIDREFPHGQRRLNVCARCGVPFGTVTGYWGDPRTAKRGRA